MIAVHVTRPPKLKEDGGGGGGGTILSESQKAEISRPSKKSYILVSASIYLSLFICRGLLTWFHTVLFSACSIGFCSLAVI